MEQRLANLRVNVPPQPHRSGAPPTPETEDELEEFGRVVNGAGGGPSAALEDEDELRSQHLKGKGRAKSQVLQRLVPKAKKEAKAHPPDQSDRPCWHYKTGACTFGPKCKYKHENCRHFSVTGKCKYGKECKFPHVRAQPATEDEDGSESSENSPDSPLGGSKRSSSKKTSVLAVTDTAQPLHFAYTPTLLQTSRLEVAYPRLQLSTNNGPVPSVNPHLCLHIERFMVMEETVRIMESLPHDWVPGDPPDLVDHWGAPLRLWKALKVAYDQHPTCRALPPHQRQAWKEARAARWLSNVPSLISNDDLRHQLALGTDVPVRVCRCDDFPCVHAPAPIAILDVHGLYYRSPSQIADMLVNTGAVMYSIAHWFDPEAGTGEFWGGEGRWRRDEGAAATVTMDVDGATVRSYKHSDLSWLPRLPTRRGQYALGVDLVMQHPSQRCYCFRVTEDPWLNEDKPEEQLSFVASASPSVWGTVDLFPQQKALATQSLKVGSIQLYSMGPFWDWSSDDRHVWVSKAMVEQGARYMAGQARTPETRNNLIMWLERKMRINGAHPDVTAASIHVTAFLSLLLHTEESMWAMHAFNGMGVFMSIWNQLLEGKPMRCWHWWMVALWCMLCAFLPKFVLWGLRASDGTIPGVFGANATATPGNTTATNFDDLRANAPPAEDINLVVWLGFSLLLLIFRYGCMTRDWMDKRALLANWIWPAGGSDVRRVAPPYAFKDVSTAHCCTREEFRSEHVGPSGRVNRFAIRAVVPVPKPFVSDAKMVLSANPLERRVRHSAHLTYSGTFPDVLPSVPSTGPASLAGAASRLAASYYDKGNEEVVDSNLDALADWYEKGDCANTFSMIASGVLTWGAGRTPEQLIPWFEGCRSRLCWDVDQSRFDSHQREKLKRLVHRLMKRLHSECVEGAEPVMAYHDTAYTYMTERMGGRVAHFSYRTSVGNASGSGVRREECFRVPLVGCAVTGAMETADFATFTMGLVTYYSLVRQMGSPSEAPERFRILCCGDDTVIKWLGRRTCTLSEFEETMRCLGFKAKVHEEVAGENVVYCSSLAWMGACKQGDNAGSHRPVLGPLPFRQLSKFSTMCNPPLGFTRAEAARGKALSMIKRANHVPLLGTYLRRVLEYTSDVSDAQAAKIAERERMARWAQDSSDGPYDLTAEGVQQFLARYDMSMDEYRRLDALMATHQPDHYYRDDQISRCLAVDCDVEGVQGAFQTTDHLQASPFRPHYDMHPDLAIARAIRPPRDLIPQVPTWPTIQAMDFPEWFEHYKANVGAATLDGGVRPGRAANVQAERDRYLSGNTTSVEYAVKNTDVLVKVEALCKSAYAVDEHFAPRAIESDKEAMIAMCGPYVKTLHNMCHRLFPFPGAVAIRHEVRLRLPLGARGVDRCAARLRQYKWLVLFCVAAAFFAALTGALANPESQKYASGHALRDRKDVYHESVGGYSFSPPPPLPDPAFWPDFYLGGTDPLQKSSRASDRVRHTGMPSKAPKSGAVVKAAAARVARAVRQAAGARPKGQKKARKGGRRRGMPPRMGGVPGVGATVSAAVPAAVAFDYKPILRVRRIPGGEELHMSDMVFPVTSSALGNLLQMPFTFDIQDQSVLGSTSVAALLRQKATTWSRFRVKMARAAWFGTCATNTPGQVGVAIVAGDQQPPATAREMALYQDAAFGSVWSTHSTRAWRPRELRNYNTQRAGPSGAPTLTNTPYPFSVMCVTDPDGTSVVQGGDLGNVFLEVVLEFYDECPPLSTNLVISRDRTIDTGGIAANTLEPFGFNTVIAMVGDFGWSRFGVHSGWVPSGGINSTVGGTSAATLSQSVSNAQRLRLERGEYWFNMQMRVTAPTLDTASAVSGVPAASLLVGGHDTVFVETHLAAAAAASDVPADEKTSPNASGDLTIFLAGYPIGSKNALLTTYGSQLVNSTTSGAYRNFMFNFFLNEAAELGVWTLLASATPVTYTSDPVLTIVRIQ